MQRSPRAKSVVMPSPVTAADMDSETETVATRGLAGTTDPAVRNFREAGLREAALKLIFHGVIS